MKFFVYDPGSHCSDERAEQEADNAEAAIIAYLASTEAHPGESPFATPVLARRHDGVWQTFGVRGVPTDDGGWKWEVVGRWTGRKVPPPEEP